MMARRFASDAERYRAHRAAITLAQELDCTPAMAEAELERRESEAKAKADREEAREQWKVTYERLRAKQAEPMRRRESARFQESNEPSDERWMMRS